FFFQAEDGIRDFHVTGVQTCALPISDGILATPVETVPRAKPNPRAAGPGPDIARIADIVREYEAVEIVVGLPRTLRGEKGNAARSEERRVGKERRRP